MNNKIFILFFLVLFNNQTIITCNCFGKSSKVQPEPKLTIDEKFHIEQCIAYDLATDIINLFENENIQDKSRDDYDGCIEQILKLENYKFYFKDKMEHAQSILGACVLNLEHDDLYRFIGLEILKSKRSSK